MRVARVMPPMANLSVWRKGCFGMESIITQIQIRHTRLFLPRGRLLRILLPALGEGLGPPQSTTATAPPAETTITRRLVRGFFGLNITIFSRTDESPTGRGTDG